MTEARRDFTNELGNKITIVVTDTPPDDDLVCTACRWRGGHDPACARASEPWPTVRLSDDKILVWIGGPTSHSQNFLTRIEAAQLRDALAEAL